jgi:hypothetical protein
VFVVVAHCVDCCGCRLMEGSLLLLFVLLALLWLMLALS